jgi:hypothetical protein
MYRDCCGGLWLRSCQQINLGDPLAHRAGGGAAREGIAKVHHWLQAVFAAVRELLDGVHEELSLHVFYAQVGLHTPDKLLIQRSMQHDLHYAAPAERRSNYMSV